MMEHCTVQRLDVYEQPNKVVEEGIAQSSGGDVIVTVTPHFSGFVHLPDGR